MLARHSTYQRDGVGGGAQLVPEVGDAPLVLAGELCDQCLRGRTVGFWVGIKLGVGCLRISTGVVWIGSHRAGGPHSSRVNSPSCIE